MSIEGVNILCTLNVGCLDSATVTCLKLHDLFPTTKELQSLSTVRVYMNRGMAYLYFSVIT